MNRAFFTIALLIFVNSSVAFAIGGEGATCNPSTVNWGSCGLSDIPIRALTSETTIAIPGGNYTSPYIVNTSNKEYVLQGDITASGTAIRINASNVVINLNGYTITYGQTTFGEGINFSSYGKSNIAIVNGSIKQGGNGEGNEYGQGCNPILNGASINYGSASAYEANSIHIANMYLEVQGRDVSAISLKWGNNHIVEQVTINDNYNIGTIKNRHAGVKGIDTDSGDFAIIRNNTINNWRHQAIRVRNNSDIYGNKIELKSIDTNSYGVFGMSNVKVYNNTIEGRGEHPIGIFWGVENDEAENIEIYGNYIDVKTTQLGMEYPNGNYSAGFRLTAYSGGTAGINNLRFYDNEIVVNTDSALSGIWSHNGEPVVFNSKGRGLFVGNRAGRTSIFARNIITVLDKDGSGLAFGIACTNNFSESTFFYRNQVRANISNIVLSDEYGACEGYPLFLQNSLIKISNFANYRTISSQTNGYFTATGRLVGNTYSNGASAESINLNPAGSGKVSVYFGNIVNDQYLYDYRLHDNNGSNVVLLKETYNPPITLPYALPKSLLFLSSPRNLRLH